MPKYDIDYIEERAKKRLSDYQAKRYIINPKTNHISLKAQFNAGFSTALRYVREVLKEENRKYEKDKQDTE